MILEAWLRARDGERPPGGASRLVVDEAQDMTPLEIRLVLSWGQLVDRLVLGLDDDQAINRWRGGDPEPLLALRGDGVADHILDQSYRVPESVRLAAEQWVKRLGSRRHEKLYRPRCDDAGNEVLGAAHHSTRRLGDPALIKEIVTEIDAGRTVMVIAACNYMLAPLIANLRAEGLPFHNPYRPADGAWNPLGRTGDGVTSTAQRIGHYLALNDRDWTGADIVAWLDMIKLADAGMHARAKKVASGFDPRGAVPFEDVAALFVDEQARNRATEPDLDWLAGCLLKDYRTRALYPIQIAKMHGVDALAAKPQCVVGTVHSVKGAAADVVYLCPDVSPAGARSMATRAGVDEAIRQFYVGMTRAYQRLCVLSPSTKRHVRPTELIPSELEVLPQ
jgi:superfamily I DNA/RNA helicase